MFSWLNMVQSQACARILFLQQFQSLSSPELVVLVCVSGPQLLTEAPDPSPASGLPSWWAGAGRATGGQGPLPSWPPPVEPGGGCCPSCLRHPWERSVWKIMILTRKFSCSCRGFWHPPTKESFWALCDCVILLFFPCIHLSSFKSMTSSTSSNHAFCTCRLLLLYFFLLTWWVDSYARAAITKCHKWWTKPRNVLSQSSGGRGSEVKVSAGWFLQGRLSWLGASLGISCGWALWSPPHVLVAFSPGVCLRVSLCPGLPFL